MNSVHQLSDVPIALSYADNEVVTQLSWLRLVGTQWVKPRIKARVRQVARTKNLRHRADIVIPRLPKRFVQRLSA